MATSTKLSINIYPLKIMLDTNIPNKSGQAILFDKSLIHSSAGAGTAPLQTGNFNNYPYFTMDVKYPEAYLQTLPYDKRMEFFFNKSLMLRILKTQTTATPTVSADSAIATIQTSSDTIQTLKESKQKYDNQQYIRHIKENETTIPGIATLTVTPSNQFSLDGSNLNFIIEGTPIKNMNEYLTKKKDIFDKHFNEFMSQIKNAHDCHERPRKDKEYKPPDVNILQSEISYLFTFLKSIPSLKNSARYKYINELNKRLETINQVDFKIDFCKKDKTKEELTVMEIIKGMYNELTKTGLKTIQNEMSDALNEIKQTIDEEIKPAKELLSSQIEDATQSAKDNEIAMKTNKINQQYETGEFNILCMLRVLFSTKYPFSGNNLSSFQMVVMRNPELNFKLTDFLPGFVRQALQPVTYTYLKIGGKVYTVTQTVWINDIYNHPDYGLVVKEFRKLMLWKERETVKLEKETQTKMEKFKKEYDNYFTQEDKDYIKSQIIKNIDDKNITREIKTNYINFNNAIETFLKAISDFESSIKRGDSSINILDNATNLKTSYSELMKLGFKTKQKFNNITDNLQKQLENIQVNEYILENYMKPEGINLGYEKEKDMYKQRLKEKFGEYTNFLETMKRFTTPKRESSNYYLQQTIDGFLNNTDEDEVFNYIMNMDNFGGIPATLARKSSRDIKNFKKTMNTGVSIVYDKNEPNYEIYLQVNCIGGELTDDTQKAIDCLYKNDFLGNKMEYLVNESTLNMWEITTNRMYFDLDDRRIQQRIQATTTATAATTATAPQQPLPSSMKKGGTRKLRTDFIKHYGTRRMRW